jgi:hypothetical protein
MKTTQEIADWSLEEGAYHYIARQKHKWYSEEEVRDIFDKFGKILDYDEPKQLLLDDLFIKKLGDGKE